MSDYILSCCSTIDLTNEWVKDRDLHYIPFNIIVDGQQYKDDMGLTFSPRESLQDDGSWCGSQDFSGWYW